MTTIPRITELLEDQEAQADDARMWSVTTILDVLAKHALVFWSAKEAAKYAIDAEGVWKAIRDQDGHEQAAKWIAAARFRPPHGAELPANELGSLVHLACQHYALWGARPDIVHPEVVPFLDQFDGWLDRFQPTYEAAEMVVYSPKYGYAGTADAIMTIDGMRLLVDYKTTRDPYDSRNNPKTPYPETVLQLAAYRYAELAAVWRVRRMTYFKRRYYLLSPGEQALAVPVPEVDGAACLLITPEWCELFPMRADDRAFKAFLYTLEVARWALRDYRGAVGDPIIPSTHDEVEQP